MVGDDAEGDVHFLLLARGDDLPGGVRLRERAAVAVAAQLFDLVEDRAEDIGVVVGDFGVLEVSEILRAVDDGDDGTRADDLQVGGTHYKDMSVQPWAVMEAVLTREEFIGFLKGNVIKYAMRQGKKDNTDDANKCHHYMKKLDEVLGRIPTRLGM